MILSKNLLYDLFFILFPCGKNDFIYFTDILMMFITILIG